MKVHFFFADQDGSKIDEKTYEAEMLPREGEVILTAPDTTPEGGPVDAYGYPGGSWRVYKVQYLLDNHGRLGLPTIYAKPDRQP